MRLGVLVSFLRQARRRASATVERSERLGESHIRLTELSRTRAMLEAVRSRRFAEKELRTMEERVPWRSPEEGLDLRMARSLVVAMLALNVLLLVFLATLAH